MTTIDNVSMPSIEMFENRLKRAKTWFVHQQNLDNGWPLEEGGASSFVAYEALGIFIEEGLLERTRKDVQESLKQVEFHQNPDGGYPLYFHEETSSFFATCAAIKNYYLYYPYIDKDLLMNSLNYLIMHQVETGGFRASLNETRKNNQGDNTSDESIEATLVALKTLDVLKEQFNIKDFLEYAHINVLRYLETMSKHPERIENELPDVLDAYTHVLEGGFRIDEIETFLMNWFRENQRADGSWQWSEYNSFMMTPLVLKTMISMELDEEDFLMVKKGIIYLLEIQNKNGSWSPSPELPGNSWLTAVVSRIIKKYIKLRVEKKSNTFF